MFKINRGTADFDDLGSSDIKPAPFTNSALIRLSDRMGTLDATRNLADAVASTVISSFESLPSRCKPRQREDGVPEWTALSGIVLSHGIFPSDQQFHIPETC